MKSNARNTEIDAARSLIDGLVDADLHMCLADTLAEKTEG